ncbi:GGDEF domain-containing protein [Hyalangium sp.]|uniref:GGDEF domain-containing protein n=1 Tax=Hyalangium sp. TaxID=2028555 RepID=UPI002D6E060F|nr:GGDEF domain-containing protein [Hyalangium sp.]HYH95589.1 GGDEF domain-containing protein [Hyalangium sp.]
MNDNCTSPASIADLLHNLQQSAYLIVISAKSAADIGRMFKLEHSETVLGRSHEAQFQIEDDGISRKHAKVVALGNGRFQLMDLSTNGTYLNGQRASTAPLYDGDKIQTGSNTVLKFSIQDQLEEQYQRSIYESATRDGLTRLYNKKFFMATLRKEFTYCLRHQLPLSLVMFKVDHFTMINDVYSHPAGDYVLTRIAQRVSDTVRMEDLLVRYDGSVFALMLRESAEEQAYEYAERCQRAVDRSDFIFSGTPIKATISLGVATLLNSDFAQPEDLIVAADKYLHRAKRAGRNRVDAKAVSGP